MQHQFTIKLSGIGKKFNREWIFKNVDLSIEPGSKWVLLGGNGSGKSTLLQVITGYLIPEAGTVSYTKNSESIKPERINELMSMASPYIQLTEEFSLPELIDHIRIFKPFLSNLSTKEIVSILQLEHAKGKEIRHFSSGMKQRVKLGTAILADAPFLFLDEPLSNLDANAIAWYKQMIDTYGANKTIMVCSNAIKDEYGFCEKEVNIADYKLK